MARATVLLFLPAFRLSRVLGLVAFPWPQKGRAPRYHRTLSVLFLTSVLACALHSQVTMMLKISSILDQLPGPAMLDAVVVRFLIMLCNLPVFAMLLSVTFRSRLYHRLILTLTKVDSILRNTAFRRLKVRLYLTFTMYLTQWAIVFVSLLMAKRLHPWDYLPYTCALLIMLCTEHNVVALSTVLRKRFEFINSQFEAMQRTSKGTRTLEAHCRRLRHAHAALCDALRELDATFRGPLLTIMLTHFCTIVGGIFLLYVFATGSGVYDKEAKVLFKRPDKNRILTIAVTLLFSSVRVVLLAYTCDTAVSEVNRFCIQHFFYCIVGPLS